MHISVAEFAKQHNLPRRQVSRHLYELHADDPRYPIRSGKRLIPLADAQQIADALRR